jgi:hypothetical protein
MSKDECLKNDGARMTKFLPQPFGYSSIVIRHYNQVMLQPPDEYGLPERPPRILRTDSMTPMSNGMLLGIAVAVVEVVGDLIIYGVGRWNGPPIHPVPLVIAMCIAWFMSGLGLLTVWLGIGGGRLYLRLLVIGVIAVILILVVGEGNWSAEAFACFVLFLAAGAMPFGLSYIVGLELVSAEAAKITGGAGEELRGGQFSLRQLFGWTVAATLVASVARFAKIEPRAGAIFGVTATIFSFIALGAVCAALLPGRTEAVVLRIVILCLSAVMLADGAATLIARAPTRAEDFAYLSFTTLMHTSLVSFTLLLYRRLGYRLRRRGSRRESATTNKPSAS